MPVAALVSRDDFTVIKRKNVWTAKLVRVIAAVMVKVTELFLRFGNQHVVSTVTFVLTGTRQPVPSEQVLSHGPGTVSDDPKLPDLPAVVVGLAVVPTAASGGKVSQSGLDISRTWKSILAISILLRHQEQRSRPCPPPRRPRR